LLFIFIALNIFGLSASFCSLGVAPVADDAPLHLFWVKLTNPQPSYSDLQIENSEDAHRLGFDHSGSSFYGALEINITLHYIFIFLGNDTQIQSSYNISTAW